MLCTSYGTTKAWQALQVIIHVVKVKNIITYVWPDLMDYTHISGHPLWYHPEFTVTNI